MGVLADQQPDAGVEGWVSARLPALTRFAYLVTGSQDAADDAVQSALTEVVARWDRIRLTDDPDSYVRRMIANAHITGWRRFGRRVVPVAEPTGGNLSVLGDPGDGIAVRDAVWQVCSTLPRQQRAAVVLRFYEDLEYAEIARVLQITETTVRSHVHRALAALRLALGDALEEDSR